MYVRELARVLQYLGATKDEKLLIGCTHPYQAHASIDRSIAVHPTGRSHTGVTVALGRGVLYSKSTARKINTTSCCEAELITLVKGLQQSIFLAYFLAGQGNSQFPVLVSQDNESNIKLIENGRSNSELTRHIEIVIYISGLMTGTKSISYTVLQVKRWQIISPNLFNLPSLITSVKNNERLPDSVIEN